jgi:3-isopropylmalate/(R)-2-methylmalate dehydratase small subunit
MEPISVVEAVALPLAQANIDTDQVVPARYLQKPRSENFGAFLFRDLRFRADGGPIAEFPLNQARYRDARIVVAQRNFGCGSSREHAVWALYDYGMRAVIAPSFADIFAGNAGKNGLLTIALPEGDVAAILAELMHAPGARLCIDLPSQTVRAPSGATYHFELDAYLKKCLMEGLDELGYTLTLMDRIVEFERRYPC